VNGILRFFLVIALIVIIVLSLLIYWAVKEEMPANQQAQVNSTYHLKQLSSVRGFRDLQTGRSFPYYDLDGKKSGIYETELLDSAGKSSGYLLISVSEDDFPLKEFASQGPSPRARLAKKVGHDNFRQVWLTPTFSIAVNNEGETLAEEGSYIRFQKGDESEKITRDELYQLIVKEQEAFRERNKALIKKVRSTQNNVKKSSSGLVTDYPSGNFFEYLAEGAERAPELRQIPANTGANTKNFASGCGATGWAMFIAWHDQLWNPELLRGSQDTNGNDWGPSGNPNTETAWISYTDRLSMLISEHLGTYNDEGDGAIDDDDIDRGFSFIKNRLGKTYTGKKVVTGHAEAVQGVYDIMVFDKRPVVITTPGHVSVASGFLFNWDDQSSMDNQWLYINTGWGHHKYIQSVYLEKFWYLKDITPTQKHTYSESVQNGPTTVTTRDDSGLRSRVWTFWRGVDEKIHYIVGSAGALPDVSTKVTMEIEAKYSPALTTDGNRIIMVYVRNDDTIRLMIWDPGKGWSPLNFPEIKTTVRPAISGWITDWLTVAFSDNEYGVQIISTNTLDIDASDAWPKSLLAPSYDQGKYWQQLDFFPTNSPISMVRDGLALYVAWSSMGREDEFYFIRGGHKSGVANHFMTKELPPGGISMSLINDDIYLVYRGHEGRIVIDHALASRDASSVFEFVTDGKAYLREVSGYLPSLTVMERENGAHPMTVVAWSDDSNKLNMRELSIDTEYHPMNYTSHPDF